MKTNETTHQKGNGRIGRDQESVTLWLRAAAEGQLNSEKAKEEIFNATYQELRSLARHLMKRQSADHTLQTTALVNEAAIRLMGGKSLDQISDTEHFYATVAQAMRCVLVDHARKRKAQRRGGDYVRIDLDDVLQDLETFNRVDMLELDEALEKLAEFSPTHADLLQLRFFLGMTVEEIAQHRSVSKTTVERAWRFTRAWLAEELKC